MPPLPSGKPGRRFLPARGRHFGGNDHPRDAILAEMAARGRKGWQEESGYHRRSLAENMMYRLKQLGDRLFSREFDRQVAESHVRAAIINQFVCLGMPQSVRIGQIALRRRKRRTLIAHTAALQRHHAVPAGLTFVTAASLGCASRQVKIGRQSLAGQRRLVRQTVKTLKPTGESLAITERALRHARAQLGA